MKQVRTYLKQHKHKISTFKPFCYPERKGKSYVAYYVQLCTGNIMSNFLSKQYIQELQHTMYHVNICNFRYEMLSQALFSPGVIPFFSGFFVLEAAKIDKEYRTLSNRIQYNAIKYKFRVATFPQSLIGKNFYEAVKITSNS